MFEQNEQDLRENVVEIPRIIVKTCDAFRQKMIDLDLKFLKEEEQVLPLGNTCFSSSQLKIPAQLPNIQETLEILDAALLKSSEAGLRKGRRFSGYSLWRQYLKTCKAAHTDYLN